MPKVRKAGGGGWVFSMELKLTVVDMKRPSVASHYKGNSGCGEIVNHNAEMACLRTASVILKTD